MDHNLINVKPSYKVYILPKEVREPFVGKTFLFEMTSLPTYSKDI